MKDKKANFDASTETTTGTGTETGTETSIGTGTGTDTGTGSATGQPAANLNPAPGDRQMFDNICGDFGIRIGRDGTWYYHGSPIGRKPLVKLFSTILRRDDEGRYWLITPVEKGLIEVDDVPFVAVEMTAEGSGDDQTVTLRTNLDDYVVVDAAHPLRVEEDPVSGEPSPYVLVRDNLEARLARAVYYHLVEIGEERQLDGETVFGIQSGGQFFRLGSLETPGETLGENPGGDGAP